MATVQDAGTVNRNILSWQGQWASANTAIMMIARAVLAGITVAYIVGGTGWMILGWFLSYAIFFGVNFFLMVGIAISSANFEKKPNVFGVMVVSWNPLRKFYALTFISVVDFITNIIIWSIWLHTNNVYVTDPHTNTPVVNASTYFSFHSMCGAFIFSSCIYFIYAFQFIRSLWNQKQSIIVGALDGGLKPGPVQHTAASWRQLAAGQYGRNGKLVNIQLRGGSPALNPTRDWRVIVYLAFGAIFLFSMFILLFIFFYHTFYAKSSMPFTVEFVLYWIAVGSYIIMCGFYYFGADSVRSKILRTEEVADRNTLESNWELDNEMVSYHLFGALVLFFNLIFFIDAVSLKGINKIDWKSVPKYNTAILVQSPYFYVWVTQCALNTGVLCFMFYYMVNFWFTGIWNAEFDDPKKSPDAPPELQIKSGAQIALWERDAAVYVIGVTAGLLAIWGVFYGFILSAMMGFHFMARYIYPITITFAVVFAAGVLIAIGMSFLRVSKTDDDAKKSGKLRQMFNLNIDWYLSTYRNVIAIPLTYFIQVAIMSVTTHQFFHPDIANDPSCINPPSGAPPYNPCSTYWSVAVLSMYVTSLVYMVCIVNAFSTMTTKVLVYQAGGKILEGWTS